MKRARAVLAVALAAGLAGGCSSGSPRSAAPTVSPAGSSSSPQTPGPQAAAPTGVAPGSASPSGAPAPVATPTVPLGEEPTPFTDSTHTLGCLITRTGVRCDVDRPGWQPPPRPAGCTGTWGQALVIGLRGPAGFVCGGASTLGAAVVVPAGGAVRVGDLQCVVGPRDIECFSELSNRGFRISRAAYAFH